MRKPDFERNTLRILQGQKGERAALFDLFLNDSYYRRLAGRDAVPGDALDGICLVAEAMANAGYDYATVHASDFSFAQGPRKAARTISLNDGVSITDWESFEAYEWRNPEDYDSSRLEAVADRLPDGMKLMVMGPGGVLENLIALTGYDNLCIMLFEEPDLVRAITDRIGDILLRYYAEVVDMDSVGFLCSNDDWGFNTQTFLSTEDMRRYIFPWHKRIVELAHSHGKPCILHSCGFFDNIIEDVIEDMRFDGRHSYEDKICPVEEAYERLNGRIAILGGMDMDFMARSTPEAIERRSRAMLERSRERGGYMLGTGNSVPEYIPFENYRAMLRAALESDPEC